MCTLQIGNCNFKEFQFANFSLHYKQKLFLFKLFEMNKNEKMKQIQSKM